MNQFFRKLEPASARLQTLWHRHAVGAVLPLADRQWRLEAAPAAPVSGVTVYAKLGTAECAVWLNDPDWRTAAGEILGVVPEALDPLPPTLIQAALECFAAAALAALEKTSGMACSVTRLDTGLSKAPAAACRFALRPPEGPVVTGAWTVMTADPDWRERIAGALRQLPARAGALPGNIILPAVISLAEWRAKADTLTGLAAGDVALAPVGGPEYRLTIAKRLRFRARLEKGVLTVEGGTMAETTPQKTDSGDLPPSVKELEVDLRAEVGNMAVTLDQLRRLGVGQVVEFATPVASPVILSVNGKPYADGELVDVGGRVGVRIVALRQGGAE